MFVNLLVRVAAGGTVSQSWKRTEEPWEDVEKERGLIIDALRVR